MVPELDSSNTCPATARACTLSVADAQDGRRLSHAAASLKFGSSFLLDLIDSPQAEEVLLEGAPMPRGECKIGRGDWSSVQSEESHSAGDASSTRDCSTTELGCDGDASRKDIPSLIGRRGVLCLGASKVEIIKREVEQKKLAFEDNTIPQSGDAKKKRKGGRRPTIKKPKQAECKREKRQPNKKLSVDESPASGLAARFAGFAGPRFKSSPSPMCVPIPVFDSSD